MYLMDGLDRMKKNTRRGLRSRLQARLGERSILPGVDVDQHPGWARDQVRKEPAPSSTVHAMSNRIDGQVSIHG